MSNRTDQLLQHVLFPAAGVNTGAGGAIAWKGVANLSNLNEIRVTRIVAETVQANSVTGLVTGGASSGGTGVNAVGTPNWLTGAGCNNFAGDVGRVVCNVTGFGAEQILNTNAASNSNLTFVGQAAGCNASNARNVVAVGNSAGKILSNVSNSTVVGAFAGCNATGLGSGNVFLGAFAGADLSNTVSNVFVVNNSASIASSGALMQGVFGSAGSNRMGINCVPNASFALDVSGALQASTVSATALSGTTFSGTTISGTTLSGTTLSGTTISGSLVTGGKLTIRNTPPNTPGGTATPLQISISGSVSGINSNQYYAFSNTKSSHWTAMYHWDASSGGGPYNANRVESWYQDGVGAYAAYGQSATRFYTQLPMEMSPGPASSTRIILYPQQSGTQDSLIGNSGSSLQLKNSNSVTTVSIRAGTGYNDGGGSANGNAGDILLTNSAGTQTARLCGGGAAGYSNAGVFVLFNQSGTPTLYGFGYNGSWVTGSDFRLKDNIVPISQGLSTVEQLRPSTYSWKSCPNETHLGFIAQEVQTVIPELVSDNSGTLGLNYTGLIPVLTKAIQELNEKVKVLEARLTPSQSSCGC